MMGRYASPVDPSCELCYAELRSCPENCDIVDDCDECRPCEDAHCSAGIDNYNVQLQPQCCDEIEPCCATSIVPCTQSDCQEWATECVPCSQLECGSSTSKSSNTPWATPPYNTQNVVSCTKVIPSHYYSSSGYYDTRNNEHFNSQETSRLDGPQHNQHDSTFHSYHQGHVDLDFYAASLVSSGSTSATIQSDSTDLTAVGMSSLDPFHCHWNDCDLSFLDAIHFDQHFLTDHIKPLSVPSATQHDTYHSSNELSCAWDHCGIAEPSVPALFDHVKQNHVAAEEHHRCKWLMADPLGAITPCNLCFSTAEDLTQHVSDSHVLNRQKEYICYWQDCDRCTRPFSQRQKIMRHIVVHTGNRPCKCEICGYTCSEDSVLKQHKRIHTGEKPFPCTVCHKSFSASTALSVHMRTHTGFKPLTCKFPGCGKRFSESSNLAKHMRTHSGCRSFVCDISGCGKSFQRPDQLKRHKKSVHKESFETFMQMHVPKNSNELIASTAS